MKNVGEIVAQILRALKNHEIPNPGVTRLVKILYLYEVNYFKRHRERATDLEWVFLHYGPYPVGYETVLKEDKYVITNETLEDEREFRRIEESCKYEEKALSTIDVFDEVVIDNLVGNWGNVSLKKLLNYVYFETEPMLDAKRGEVLDFSKIPFPVKKKKIIAHIPDAKLKQLQDSIEKRLGELEKQKEEFKNIFGKEFSKESAIIIEEPMVFPENTTVIFKIDE